MTYRVRIVLECEFSDLTKEADLCKADILEVIKNFGKWDDKIISYQRVEEKELNPVTHCNKCNKLIKELNELEQEEIKTEGAFICSDCINEEMNEGEK